MHECIGSVTWLGVIGKGGTDKSGYNFVQDCRSSKIHQPACDIVVFLKSWNISLLRSRLQLAYSTPPSRAFIIFTLSCKSLHFFRVSWY